MVKDIILAMVIFAHSFVDLQQCRRGYWKLVVMWFSVGCSIRVDPLSSMSLVFGGQRSAHTSHHPLAPPPNFWLIQTNNEPKSYESPKAINLLDLLPF